ncbi:MAG: hypothetical protein J6C82_04935 [Clostridia bacterium]|nr:hypothetical protein [Clostridia bacterium]
MKMSVEVNVSVSHNLAKVRDKTFWLFAANEYHRLVSPYVPFQSGNLDETVNITSTETGGENEYISPYAHYIYEGKAMGPTYYAPDYGFWSPPGQKKHYTGEKLEISKSRHPLASDHWDKAAEPTQKPKLIDSMQGYVNSGRLNLNG